MIPLLEESLCVEDALGFTILHTCCDMLRKDLPRADFFLTSLRNLVACASSQGFGKSSQQLTQCTFDDLCFRKVFLK